MKKTIPNNPFTVTSEKVKLIPGRYLVIDPSYAINDSDMWSMVCEALPSGIDPYCMKYANQKFFVQSTAHGDGTYRLTRDGKNIGLCNADASLLSIIPESLVKHWKSEENYSGVWPDIGGVWVNITEDTEVEPYGTGNFKFGPFDMNTQGEDED